MENPVEIYFATSANKGAERLFNISLTELLEQRGYKVFLPQRDGIDVDGLSKVLGGKISEEKITQAIESTKYLLNMGLRLPESDVVLSNLDNPDEDTILKTRNGRILHKTVICFKTYAPTKINVLDEIRNREDFLTYQGDKIIIANFPATVRKEAEERLAKLAEKIDEELKLQLIVRGGVPPYAKDIPFMGMIIEGARKLFKGTKDFNSTESLEIIAQRIADGGDKYILTPQIKYLAP